MARWFPSSSSSGAAANLGVCILAGSALIAAATWASGDSTPRRQARGTHVGVPPSDMVTLISSGNGTTLKFLRANADGTTDASEFSVPTGQQLVVTDVDWAGHASSIGTNVVLRLWIENKASPSTRRFAHLKSDSLIYAVSTSGGGTTNQGGSSSGFLTGFCVSSAARLTADISASGNMALANFGSATWTPTILVRGYLTADE